MYTKYEIGVEMAGSRTFRIQTSSQHSVIYSKKEQYTHSKTNAYKMTKIHTEKPQKYTQNNYNNTQKTTTKIHTKQLQQYTRPTYNNTYGQPTTITHKKTQNYQQYTRDKLEYNM